VLFDIFVACHAAGAAVLSAIILGGCLRTLSRKPPSPSVSAHSLSIVIPAYNAAGTLQHIERALALSRDVAAQAIVVDDGSDDGSGPALATLCEAHGALLLRHQTNRGKAAALNTGTRAASAALVVTIDADTEVARSALQAASQLFTDPALGAVALEICAAPGNVAAMLQRAEYRYVLEVDRRGLSGVGQVHTVPGAASIWRRSALIEIGLFSDRTLAEDTDTTIALRAVGWMVTTLPGALATTLVPRSIGALLRQRVRWIWGTLQSSARQGWDAAVMPRRHATPALCFGAIACFHVSGFVLPLWTLLAAVQRAVDSTALYGLFVIVGLGMGRLTVSTWLRDGSLSALPKLLLCAGAMHAVNTIAFWHGLLIGAPFRRRWR
jgi:cellulose synthase/poly-beta-1,6-N-acetylglucosamine synthase-like glycosyltransferase